MSEYLHLMVLVVVLASVSKASSGAEEPIGHWETDRFEMPCFLCTGMLPCVAKQTYVWK